MTKQETIQLLALISSTYRREFSSLSAEEKRVQASLWYEAFESVPAEQVVKAVKDYIFTDKTGFAPTIGKITEMVGVKPKKRPIESYPSFQQTVREFMADYNKEKLLEGRAE